MKRLIFIAAVVALLPTLASAQGEYGRRLQGANGWLLPVATTILGSDEEKHLARGSVNAWDLVAPQGSAIYAMAPGTVEYAGCNNAGGYGCWVLLQHADGYTSSYGHMIEGSIRVRSGQPVAADTLLGQIGWTGQTSFGPHTHFEIRKGGQFLRIDQFFDINAMRQCNLCSVQGQPVAAQGVATGQRTATIVMPSKGLQLLQALASLPAEQFATLLSIVVGALMLIWWLSGLYVRVALVAIVTTTVVGGCIALLFVPAQVQAVQQSAVIGGDAWKTAYAFMRKWEGNRCVHDPVRTLKGITQGTYTAWRKSQGLGNADVCTSLTEEQAETIYHQRYWLASGADKLEPAAALVVFDHAVNAGVGEGVALVAQCGSDVSCLIAARMADYRTKGNWRQYGQAWTNRVNDLVKFLKEGK